jgi:hypothetical protein
MSVDYAILICPCRALKGMGECIIPKAMQWGELTWAFSPGLVD